MKKNEKNFCRSSGGNFGNLYVAAIGGVCLINVDLLNVPEKCAIIIA